MVHSLMGWAGRGAYPRWRRDGKEMFCLSLPGQMITAAPVSKPGVPKALLDTRELGASPESGPKSSWRLFWVFAHTPRPRTASMPQWFCSGETAEPQQTSTDSVTVLLILRRAKPENPVNAPQAI